MNDNDINEKEVIDAMSYCFAVGDCERCAYRDKPCADLMGDGLLIIKRQKAEIERLKAENSELRLKMSYMKEPNTIGDIHEMGAW